jgi:hypothetical protein
MTENTRPTLPLLPAMGMIALMWSASVYSGFGLSSFPRQEWLLELLVAAVFLLAVINLLVRPGTLSSAVRVIGAMLILHSVWDALHWPGNILVDTPIDPRIPRLCPVVDLILGPILLIRGK